MEGLIPMVYKVFKRNRVRRQYRSLSSGAAQSYNIADFYTDDQSHVYTVASTQKIGSFHMERNGHCRHKSVGDYDVGFASREETRMEAAPPASQQIVRFRSRRLFSCVTGGA
ncbi:hypothetical protein CJ030_MR3G026068 [Morella rubra]|uniref:Uncharacterized protein n=1 Tax=Morella rubra TaxID=262757 RepID=A0A6A1W347_9ROSI|nr:hypothetical protein CJ030_MR3G026068 [Morella rubra]